MSPDRPQELESPESDSSPENGGGEQRLSRVYISIEIPQGTSLRVTVESLPAQDGFDGQPAEVLILNQAAKLNGEPVKISLPVSPTGVVAPGTVVLPGIESRPDRRASLLHSTWSRLRETWEAWPYSLEATLFGLGLFIYLFTRLVKLGDYPIFFFTDEAVQTVLAADLVRDNFHNYDKVFLPTYFKNGNYYNLSLSVYLQVIPYLLFAKSVFVTRLVSVLVTLLAAVSVGLLLRDFFQARFWWAGPLLLSIMPAWFLHSRTAFETVLFTSMYAGLLYAYLLYRLRSPRYLYAALVLAALAFYSYSPGQLIVALTGVLLLLSDARYHWQHRALLGHGLLLVLALALPYLRFRLMNSFSPIDHLVTLGSYWVQPLSLGDKVSRFISEHLYALSPGYLFVPNDRDLVRHLMKGYGHLTQASFPFYVLGLILALKGIRSSANRMLLIALLVAPAGAALVQVGITRVLVIVVPATLLVAIGVSKFAELLLFPGDLLGRLRLLPKGVRLQSWQLPYAFASTGLFAILLLANLSILRDALVNGPTWFGDYGLGGMQYGARQLFGALQSYLAGKPGARIIVSPSWANGADVVARFFLPEPLPISLGSIEGYLFEHLPLDAETMFVMLPEEYDKALSSGKFTDVQVEHWLPYPDGRPGFYFVRLQYSESIDQILAAEREARRALLEGQVSWKGQDVEVRYPHLDMGQVKDVFDGDPNTLIRTLEMNPAVIELHFSEPVQARSLYLRFGSTEVDLIARLFAGGDSSPKEYSSRLYGTIEKPDGAIDFPETLMVEKVYLEIKDARQGEPGHVHVWEIDLR